MPLVYRESINPFTQLGIWEITESFSDINSYVFSEEEKRYFESLKKKNRKKQSIAGRILLKMLVGLDQNVSVQYDRFGKPYLLDMPFKISLSHSGVFVAALVSHQECGVDIQKIDSKIERIASKFLNADERSFIDGKYQTEQLHVIWGAKESLYKLYGKKQLDFKDNMHTLPFNYKEKGVLQIKLNKEPIFNNYNVFYEKRRTYMLVYIPGVS